MIRFFHIADCHVGSWRDSFLQQLNLKNFKTLMDEIILEHSKEKISFVLISGDLFNTALPSIDSLKTVIEGLKKIKDKGINIYGISGSHDYSASGKSMLGVLEKADLFIDVMKYQDENKTKLKFIQDPSGIKITGMYGKKGGLEKTKYDDLDYSILEEEPGEKIFLFHTGITEYMPKNLKNADSVPLSFLPKNFLYYAGGHIHYRFERDYDKGKISYPGPVFPNSFKELKDLLTGSYVIGTINENKIETEIKKIQIPPIKIFDFHAEGKDTTQLRNEIEKQIREEDIKNKIIMLEIKGNLSNGNLSDLQLERIKKEILEKGALCFIKNTFGLNVPQYESEIKNISDMNELEEQIIQQKIESSEMKNNKFQEATQSRQKELIQNLFKVLNNEKMESENKNDYEKRLIEDFEKTIQNETSQ